MQQDEDPSTLCDVFEQMLQVNEDLLAAVAEQQKWNDSPPDNDTCLQNAAAYQLLLHKNLVEMANFVDSLCGVFVSVDGGSSGMDAPFPKKPRTASHDEPPSHGMTKEPSLLLSTLHANESLRARRRTEKKFLSFQKKVKEQEDHDKLPLPLLHAPGPDLGTSPLLPPPPPHHPSSLKGHSMLRPCPVPLPPTQDDAMPLHHPFANPSMDSYFQLPAKNRLVVAKEECLACHRLGKSVKDCRAGWKHTTPSWKTSMVLPLPPMMPSHSTLLMGMVNNMPLPTMGWPYMPTFSIPTAKVAPPTTPHPRRIFKRMCEQCKLDHQSLYQCRTVLQHVAPEWKRSDTGNTGSTTSSQRSYSRWTDVEMQTFHELVEVHGYRDVSKLAFYLQTKDKKQVKSYLQRYLKSKQDDGGDG
ncbi:hypothetical protein H257_15286 [Aphanomyces astaci]|uniref:Myb-like domain-containing protein n=1 Tax=Aphanomyces astaci TaxID=112090 RepID=W4FPR5_APHAT|nr:hypothetical protein H257_15286 [Aphanomyces astaci]ETV68946.1 hypothetical protein H257_15286 [Aphanomyces astaci]|eukprot:XP_009841623.1 hypothetical protein H257_15286 [Aphanomyces astaci]